MTLPSLLPLFSSLLTIHARGLTLTLTDAEEVAEFLEGRYYLNLHSELNMGGELRAQMTFDSTPSNARMTTVSLSPDKEVPPVTTPSNATGNASVILDPTSGRLSVSGRFSGLTSPGFVIGPSIMHIHEADPEPGQAFTEAIGDVFEGLTVVTDASDPLAGDFFGSFDASADVAEFLEGRYYLNLHTELNGGGELRGQIEF